MKSAGYRGERKPVSPVGPEVNPLLKKKPLYDKKTGIPVATPRKAVPVTKVESGKGKTADVIMYKGLPYVRANTGKGLGTPSGQMPKPPVGERKVSKGNSKQMNLPSKHPDVKYHRGR